MCVSIVSWFWHQMPDARRSPMFQVTTYSLLDEFWEERDQKFFQIAEKKSDMSTAGSKKREHSWFVPTFELAKKLRDNLAEVEGTNAVTIRECNSQR